MKTKHSKSIFRRVFFPLILIAVLQTASMYGILKINGVFKRLNENFESLLQERTENTYQTLANDMINKWTNLLTTEEAINQIAEEALKTQQKDWQDIKTDAALNAEIVKNASSELIYRLRDNNTTGIFMILDGVCVQGQEDTYAGFYLRDNDPESDSSDNSDLSLVRSLPPLSRELGFSLNSFWKPYFSFEGGREEEQNDFFFQPMDAARKAGSDKSQYFGYWSRPFYIEKNDVSIITYTIPLINSDGFVYGVLGSELTVPYLSIQLGKGASLNSQQMFYLLALTTDGGKTYEKIVSSGALYEKYVGSEEPYITNLAGPEANLIQFQGGKNKVDKIYGAVRSLKTYSSNTPFEGDQWVVIGMQEEGTLFAETDRFQRLIFISAGITLLLGLIIAALVSRSIVYPITSLAGSLKKSKEKNSLDLPYTGITEIDSLSDAIVSSHQGMMEAARRTSGLIELAGLPVGVYENRRDPKMTYCSRGFFKIVNFDAEEEEKDFVTEEELNDILAEIRKEPVEEAVYRIRKGERERYIRITSQEDPNGTIGAIMDVTEEILDKQRIEKELDYDLMTGIWNRRAFERKMKKLFSEKREELKTAALVMFDLDNLKFVNDAYGHDTGDSYIKAFAEAVQVFGTENVLIARRSGDEFYMFIYGCSSQNEIREIIRKGWNQITSQMLELPDGNLYRLRVSAGISWYPQDASEPSLLIHYADFAMYRVKHSQKGSLREFNSSEYSEDSFLINGHEALNQLIDERKVRFCFQAIYDAHKGTVFGYELLMRSEVEELRTPDVILRMAKSQGKLHHIEQLTWSKGMEDARCMIQTGKIAGDAKLFLNSIANQTLFKEEEEEIISNYRDLLPNLVMEVTEGEDNNMKYTSRKLDFVRKYGGEVAIDDFGTGYNSELAIVNIPSDVIKIDITFVRNVDTDKDKQTIICNLIRFAKQRNIKILAEGVETAEEMRTLIGFGVDYLQGYYLARPTFDPEIRNEKLCKEILEMQSERNA